MTIKYVKGVIARNGNVNSSVRDIPVYDDLGGVLPLGIINPAMSAYITRSDAGNGILNRTKLTCAALPISVADDAGVAQYGGVKLFTFPEGIIYLAGAMYTGTLTMGDTGTFIDAFTGVMALGSTTASTGATLLTTEATWLQSTAMSTASSKVAACVGYPVATQITESGCRHYDGHTTAGPVYLNVAIADDASHTAGTGHFDGTVTLLWALMGDY